MLGFFYSLIQNIKSAVVDLPIIVGNYLDLNIIPGKSSSIQLDDYSTAYSKYSITQLD